VADADGPATARWYRLKLVFADDVELG